MSMQQREDNGTERADGNIFKDESDETFGEDIILCDRRPAQPQILSGALC